MLRTKLEMIYAYQRRIDAKKCLREAQVLEKQLKGLEYPWMEAQLALEQSICGGMTGKFDVGRRALDSAIEISGAADYGILKLRTVGMQASYFTDTGNTVAAWNEDLKGLAQYWDGIYPYQRAFQFYSDLAISAQKENFWHLAAMFQREAAAMISRTPNRSVAAMAWNRYGTYAEMAGLSSEAATGFQQSDRLFDQLSPDKVNLVYRLDCELNRAMAETAVGNIESPLKRLTLMHPEVLQVDDKTVLKHYYQTLGTLRLRQGDFTAAKDSLEMASNLSRASLPSLKNDHERFAWEQDAAVIYHGLVEVLFRGQYDPDAAFREWKSYHAALFGANQPSNRNTRLLPDLRDKGSVFPRFLKNVALITYVQLSHGVAIWVTDAGGKTRSKWTDVEEASLSRLANQFIAECSDPHASLSKLQEDGRTLYQLLIEPVAEYIKHDQLLLVETDGAITNIPVQALVDATGNFLGLEHPIVLSQGAEQSTAWDHLVITRRMRALVVGDPVLSPELISSFPPLSHAKQEAEFVSGLFHTPLLLVKKEATLQAVKDGLERIELFHFAGHAVSTPSGGWLLLAGSTTADVLDSRILEQLSRKSRKVVVMSSCSTETGAAAVIHPEGLAHTFLANGVLEVVASRWNVDSDVTQRFMEKFYPSLLQGKPVPAALKDASVFIHSQPGTSHPYYWAPFNVYVGGSGR